MNFAKSAAEPRPDRDEAWPPYRILCVDDNPDCAESTALLLRVMGFESLACYDGKTALELNDSFRPGVCFVDLNMPGMDGDELARKLRKNPRWSPLVIIAVTAMSNEDSQNRIKDAAFDMHFIKPVDPGTLVDMVNQLFQAAGFGLQKQFRPQTQHKAEMTLALVALVPIAYRRFR